MCVAEPVPGDDLEHGEEEGDLVPSHVNSKARFYGYFKKNMLERIEYQADKASEACDRKRFTRIMSHVFSMMDIIDEDIAAEVEGLPPRPRQRLVPAYKKYKFGPKKVVESSICSRLCASAVSSLVYHLRQCMVLCTAVWVDSGSQAGQEISSTRPGLPSSFHDALSACSVLCARLVPLSCCHCLRAQV